MLEELHSRNSVIIITAKKGSAVVILDASDYLKKAKRKPRYTKN